MHMYMYAYSHTHSHLHEHPGNVVDCRQFVEYGCLSYLIMALSSLVKEMRSAAGHALTRFSHHLDGSRFREKAQVSVHYRLDVEKE